MNNRKNNFLGDPDQAKSTTLSNKLLPIITEKSVALQRNIEPPK